MNMCYKIRALFICPTYIEILGTFLIILYTYIFLMLNVTEKLSVYFIFHYDLLLMSYFTQHIYFVVTQITRFIYTQQFMKRLEIYP